MLSIGDVSKKGTMHKHHRRSKILGFYPEDSRRSQNNAFNKIIIRHNKLRSDLEFFHPERYDSKLQLCCRPHFHTIAAKLRTPKQVPQQCTDSNLHYQENMIIDRTRERIWWLWGTMATRIIINSTTMYFLCSEIYDILAFLYLYAVLCVDSLILHIKYI
jgi:hypothetical protein